MGFNNVKLTNEIVDKRLKGRNIKRIGNYKNGNIKIKFKCLVKSCGYEWNANPNNILNNRGCPKCSHHIKLTNETVDKRLKGRNIKRIGNYKNIMAKIKFKCLKCNHIWKTPPDKILNANHGCPRCSNRNLLSNGDIDKKLQLRNIKRIGNYKNIMAKIKFKCLKCNHIWKTSSNKILNGSKTGCPMCSVGKSEFIIFKLIKNIINFKILDHHYPIHYENKKYYPDFYLEVKNKKIIIEYNGEQHYMPVKFGGISQYRANKNFIKQKIRDRQIKKYCKSNNIILLEIPYYWKENKIIETLKLFNN